MTYHSYIASLEELLSNFRERYIGFLRAKQETTMDQHKFMV
jgi:hypothetical protein